MFTYTIKTDFQFNDKVRFQTDHGTEGVGVIYMVTLDYDGQIDYGVLLDGENVVEPGLLSANLTLLERAENSENQEGSRFDHNNMSRLKCSSYYLI